MGELPRRPGPMVRARVTEHGASSRTHEDRLVTEEPLEIRIAWPGRAAHTVWLTMRTPGHDFELAAGWATHEGVLAEDGLDTVAYCTDRSLRREQEFNVVTLGLCDQPAVRPGGRHLHASSANSACGVCGKDSVEEALAVPRPASAWAGGPPEPAVVRRLPAALREQQSLFARTGGVHAAGLFDASGAALVVREDVGRHNAVDKVTGSRVLAGQPTAEAVLVVSGRAGFELVQKAVSAGVGALVAVGAPTSLSVELARRSGLSLFGFTGPDRTVQYV